MQVLMCVMYLVLYQTFGMSVQNPLHRNIGKSVQAQKFYVSTICKPREILVKVKDEFPEVMHRLIPSCVPLQRCGGCCTDEALQCVHVSTHTTVVQLKQITNNNPNGEIIERPFVEHSQCECRSRNGL